MLVCIPHQDLLPTLANWSISGRRALAQSSSSAFYLRRSISTQDNLSASADNSLKQLHALESQINANAPVSEHVPSLDPENALTEPASAELTESVAEQYHRYKQQRESHSFTPTLRYPKLPYGILPPA